VGTRHNSSFGWPRSFLLGLLLCLLLGNIRVHGAEPVVIDTATMSFSKLTIDNGLSQGMIYCIAQDHSGFMWFGSKDGLNRYDGYEFTVFRHDPSDSGTVRGSMITALEVDRHGRLWVGTAVGLDLFDPRTEGFIHVPIPYEPGDWGSVTHIILDDHGDLWVGTHMMLVKLTFSRPFTDTDLPDFTVTWFGEGSDNPIGRTRDGTLWGTFNRHASRITPVHGATDVVDTIALMEPPLWNVTFGALSIVEDTLRGKLYGLYQNGVVLIDPGTGEMEYLFRDLADHRDWLQGTAVVDSKGNIWMATLGGLYLFDPQERRMMWVQTVEQDMRAAIRGLKSSFIDRSGTIWLGTTGYGLLKYDQRVERFNQVRDNSILSLSMTMDGKLLVSRYHNYFSVYDPVAKRYSMTLSNINKLWPEVNADTWPVAEMTVQTRDGAYWSYHNASRRVSRYHPEGPGPRLVRPEIAGVPDNGHHFPLHMGIDGALWCGGDKAFWRIDIDTQECTPHPWPVPVVNNQYPFTTAIHQGVDGTVWVGTLKGLLRFDPATGSWVVFGHDPHNSRSLSVSTVFSICPDPQDPVGVLWIGTNGGGLNRFDVRSGTFTQYTTRDGLPNDVVYGVLSDTVGCLWMSTNKGIARFDPRTATFRNFSLGDGLQSNEFNRHAYCKDSRGWLYFGGVSGFNFFDPLALQQDSTPVVVRLTGIRLMNQPIPFGQDGSPLALPAHLSSGMEIPYSANMVTFTFATMEYGSRQAHEYRYRLEGFDENWIMGSTNSAVYTNLDPGTYIFRVCGRNRDGIWDTIGTSFSLTVRPPWWRTWWFYALSALVVIGGTLMYIRSLRRQKVVLERIVADRTRELKQEMDRSVGLLLNILPAEVAEELKAKGEADAVQLEQVTVLFTDFKGFTEMSEQVTPRELVKDLHECFSAFDHICAKHGLEKIKTIGDAYMAAGGLPVPNTTHPRDVVRAALDMRDFIAEGKARKIATGRPFFEIRIGIHTGPVVAGIVGVKKFQYDIWGDTVNTASRMESSGEVGRVNISEATYAIVKDSAIVEDGSGATRRGGLGNDAVNVHRMRPAFTFTPRGKVQAKGKGEMAMYFVEHSAVMAGIRAE
jgi:class 3 adenylate cyclase/ligand-binding sensor domain-containing protein